MQLRTHGVWLGLLALGMLGFALAGCDGEWRSESAGLMVSSEPSGAKVYIEGELVGTTPFTTTIQYKRKGDEFKPAVISVTAYKDGYHPQVRRVSVGRYLADSPDRSYSFLLILASVQKEASGTGAPPGAQQQMLGPTIVIGGEPQVLPGKDSKQLGALNITSEPPGADVYVDDRPVGKTPVTVAREAGACRVRLVLSGYSDVSQEVTVRAGESMTLVISMARKGNAGDQQGQ